jgi:hypothetical protein
VLIPGIEPGTGWFRNKYGEDLCEEGSTKGNGKETLRRAVVNEP